MDEGEATVYGCEVLFDQQGAKRVREGIKRGLGVSLCPCEAGQPCPLLPADLVLVLAPWEARPMGETIPVNSLSNSLPVRQVASNG